MVKVVTMVNDEKALRRVSEPCVFDEQLKKDIELIKSFSKSQDIYAIAAVQLGIPKRILYIKTTSPATKCQLDKRDEERLYINPKILSRKGKAKYWEFCVSCMDKQGMRYASLVTRPYEIEIEYQNAEAKTIKETLTGLAATIFCHEYDHLNGVLQIDKAEKNLMMKQEDRWALREKEPYIIISKDCKFED